MAKRTKDWSYGLTNPTLSAIERGEVVTLRWYEDRKPKRKSLGFAVRDEKGKLDPEKVRYAEDEVRRYHSLYVQGTTPDRVRDTEDPEALTLRQGLDEVLDLSTGRWRKNTAHYRAMVRHANRLCQIFGEKTLWVELTPTKVSKVWRVAAEKANGTMQGYRPAELSLVLLYTAANFLRTNLKIPLNACLRPKGLSDTMKAEWLEIAGLTEAQVAKRKAEKQSRRTFSQAETKKLLEGFHKAPPRLRFLLLVGANLRGGQVRRVKRSNVDLTPGTGAFGNGEIVVEGRGKKRGATVAVDSEVASFLKEAFGEGGYLYHHERAYQAGEIPDYPMVPGFGTGGVAWGKALGEVGGTKAKDKALLKPMAPKTLYRMFRTYQEACGVEYLKGRQWYGLRRRFSDEISRHATDRMATNVAQGWAAGSTMGDAVYRNEKDERTRLDAATARKAAFAALRGKTGGDDGLLDRTVAALLAADPETLKAVAVLLGTVEEARGPARIRTGDQRFAGVSLTSLATGPTN